MTAGNLPKIPNKMSIPKDRLKQNVLEGEARHLQKVADDLRYKATYAGLSMDEVEKNKAKVLADTKFVADDFKSRMEQASLQLEADMTDLQGMRQTIEEAMKVNPQAANSVIPEYNQRVDQYEAKVKGLEQEVSLIEDMETSAERELRLLAQRELEINKETGTILGATGQSITKGIGSMTAGATSYLIDAMAAFLPEKFLAPKQYDESGNEVEVSRDQVSKEAKRMLLPDTREGATEINRMLLRKMGVTPTTKEYYQDAQENNFVAGALLGLGQSVPAMITPNMTGIFFQTTDAIGQELEGEEYDDIPEAEKLGLKTATGIPAMLLERWGFRNLAGNNSFTKRIVANALDKAPGDVTAGQLQRILDAETRSAIKNFGIQFGGGALAEAETGASQEAVDQTIRLAYNRFSGRVGPDGKSVLSNPDSIGEAALEVLEAGVAEAIGGGFMSAPFALSKAMSTGKVTKDMDDRQYEMLESLISDPSYKEAFTKYTTELVERKKMSPADQAKAVEDLRVAESIVSKIPPDMDADKRRQAFDLLLEKDRLRSKDNNLVGDKVATIDAKLMELAGVKVDTEAKKREVKYDAAGAISTAPPALPDPSFIAPTSDQALNARTIQNTADIQVNDGAVSGVSIRGPGVLSAAGVTLETTEDGGEAQPASPNGEVRTDIRPEQPGATQQPVPIQGEGVDVGAGPGPGPGRGGTGTDTPTRGGVLEEQVLPANPTAASDPTGPATGTTETVVEVDPELDEVLDIKRQDVKADTGTDTPLSVSNMTPEKATNLLKKVSPGLKVVFHKDQPSLSKAYARNSGRNVKREETATTKGFYDTARKEIHIGPFASGTTLAHEAMHPLFRAALADKPELVDKLYSEMVADPDLAPYVAHGNRPGYKAKGEAMVKEEAIVQLMAAVYEGQLDQKFALDKGFLQKVRDFIKGILAQMGLRKNEVNFSDIKDLKQMAGLIHDAMRMGAAADVASVDGRSELVDQAFDGPETPKTPIGDTKTVMVDGKERTVFNSNGKPIHPTVEGVRNFWRWFGDSKVVDEQGRPLVMYHGTDVGRDSYKSGTFFTPDARYASAFAGTRANERNMGLGGEVAPAYLRITSPLDLESFNERMGVSGGIKGFKLDSELIRDKWKMQAIQLEMKDPALADEFFDSMDKMDGVIGRDAGTNTPSMMITDPTQIKSATGNYGTFDPGEASIVMARGTPQEIADTFKRKGYTKDRAKKYMEDAAVDQETIDGVLSSFDPPAVPPSQPKAEPKEGPGKKEEHATAKRFKAKHPELYALFSEDDIKYERLPNAVSLDAAEQIVGYVGADRASNMANDPTNGIPAAVRVFMARMAIRQMEREGRLVEAAIASGNLMDTLMDMGQGIQAMRDLPEFYSPALVLTRAKAQVEQLVKEKLDNPKEKKKFKALKKGLKDLNQEVVEEVLREGVVGGKVVTAATPQKRSSATERVKKAFSGDNNTLIKKSRKDEIVAQLRGRFSAGVDPLNVELAAFYLEAGARGFAAVAEEVSRELGRKAVPFFKDAYKEAFKYLKDRGLDIGEPESDAVIDQEVARHLTLDLVERLKKAIGKNDRTTAASIVEQLSAQAKDMDAWGAYSEYATKRIQTMADKEIAEARATNDAMREFTDGLVQNITAQMREEADAKGAEQPDKPTKKTDIEIIGDAFRNFDKYQQVWKDTQNKFQARKRVAEARLEKAETPEAKAEAQDAIAREEARLEKLDAYFGDLLVKPFSDQGLGRAVSKGMKDLGQKIDQLVRLHYTKSEEAKRNLQQKLVQDAGLKEPEATVLANAIEAEFDKRIKGRKEKLIKQFIGRYDPNKERAKHKKRQEGDETAVLDNIGAFTDEEFLRAYSAARGWPILTAENVKELGRLADRVQKQPVGRPRNEALTDLLNYEANLAGVSPWELAQATWYGHTLSGFETQEVNIFANTARVFMEAAVATSKNPKDALELAKALTYGFMRAIPEAKSTWKTGYSPIRGAVEKLGALERTDTSGVRSPLKLAKYTGRFMKAADVMAYEPLREMRAYQLAVAMARDENPKENVRQRALDYMNRGNTALQEAVDQATEEYNTEVDAINASDMDAAQKKSALKKAELDKKRRVYELVQQGRSEELLEESARFAMSGTYNEPPKGLLGSVARAINKLLSEQSGLRYLIPFVNVISNVAHDAANYYGVGYIRAARGGSITRGSADFKDIPDAEKDRIMADMRVKSTVGLMSLVLAMVLSTPWDDEDEPMLEVTADGNGSYGANQTLMKSGWRPYSFKVRGTDRWISYQYTPLVLPLALAGNIQDAIKYRDEKPDDKMYTKVAVALGRNMTTFFDLSFLSSTEDMLSAIVDGRNEDKLEDGLKAALKIPKRMLIPALYDQTVRNAQGAFDMTAKDARGTYFGEFLKDIPFARDMYEDRYDAFGPVVPEANLARRFQSPVETDDPIVTLLVDRGVSLNTPHPGTLTVIETEVRDREPRERVMTPKERTFFYQNRAIMIREAMLDEYSKLVQMNDKDFEKKVKSIAAKATNTSKAMIRY